MCQCAWSDFERARPAPTGLQVARVSVLPPVKVAAVREAVNAAISPQVCTALLKDGKRCSDDDLVDGATSGQHPLVAFCKAVRQAPQHTSAPAMRPTQVRLSEKQQ